MIFTALSFLPLICGVFFMRKKYQLDYVKFEENETAIARISFYDSMKFYFEVVHR